MTSIDRLIIPLRALIVLLFLGLIFAQTFSVPGQYSYLAARSPELGFLPWGLMIVVLLEIVCLQIVLVCIWFLLTLVRADRIFSPRSFRWVRGIVGSITAAWVLLLLTFVSISVFLYVTPRLRDPGLPILLLGMVLVGGVVVLTVGILQRLLWQAASLKADLEEVI